MRDDASPSHPACAGPGALRQRRGSRRQDKDRNDEQNLRSLAQEVGRDRVEAINLAPPTQDAEAYEPRPQDPQRLRGARLVVRIGLDYDLWINKLLREAPPELRRGGSGYVDASAAVPLLEIRGVSFDAAPGHSHGRATRITARSREAGADPGATGRD